MSQVCFQEDEYTQSRYLTDPRWIATLSDGRKVISDDDRPGMEPSSWQRLRVFIEESGLRITALELQNRSHVERPVPENADGYFFRKSVGAYMNSTETFGFFLVGHYDKARHKVIVQKWHVPALVLDSTEERDPDNPEQVGPSLIFSR